MMFTWENTSTIDLMAWMPIMGLGSGMFCSPNISAIMGMVPADKRRCGSRLRTMATNAGNVLSIAISMAIISSSVSPEAMQALFVGTQVGSEGIAVNLFLCGLRMAFTICLFVVLLRLLLLIEGEVNWIGKKMKRR